MSNQTKPKISVIIPVYYNEDSLPNLFSHLTKVSEEQERWQFEFVFVDDGSGDSSLKLLKEFAERDNRVKVIKLSRNFGSFTAVLAGYTHCTGDCAVMISADLQDPPELIPKMLDLWLQGNKVVIAARESRKDKLFQRIISGIYYRLMRRFALPDMPIGGFDFVLIDRVIINIIVEVKEKNTSLMGLILWTGFKRTIIYYTREARKGGVSRWTLKKKVNYFIDSFVAFSYSPIRIMQYLGAAVGLSALVYAAFIIYNRIYFDIPVNGWSSLMVVILLIGALQFFMLGIVGEYIWRIVDETKKRPTFIVDEISGNDSTLNDNVDGH